MTRLLLESIKLYCRSDYVSDVFFPPWLSLSTRLRGYRWTNFSRAEQPKSFPLLQKKRKRKEEMTEYDDRSCASNMYLPNCTYYVSTPDFTSSFLPQNTSCQINFPYTPNIAQVQPVREVAFRDYGLDHPSKWHYRGNYASYYSADELMHRDLLQTSSSRADVIFKNESLYNHRGGTSSPCNFFTGIGRNGVLPQGFDQFLDAPTSDKPSAEPLKQKTDCVVAGDGSNSQALTREDEHKAEVSAGVEEDTSSNCGDNNNQQSKSIVLARRCPL